MSQHKHQSYAFLPLEPVTTADTKTSTHYKAFRRTPRAPPDTVPDSEPELSDDDVPLTTSLEALEEAEEFRIGDVVYLPSSYQAPLAGVLTHLWTDQDDNDEKIFGVCRLLHWPEWMSTMAKKRMAGITNRHEIYYTHKASGGRRQTKTSTRTGQTNDTFEAGPSLHDYSFGVEEVIAKVNIHSSQAVCTQAIKSAAEVSTATQNGSAKKKSALAKTHTVYKNKSYPVHLFCERAVDPNRELFWRIDWLKLVAKGIQGAGWDLKDDSSDIATSIGQGVKDLVDQVEQGTPSSSSAQLSSRSANRARSTSVLDEDEADQLPKRRPGRPRNSESLSAGVASTKRKNNRRADLFHSDSEVASDDSFQSGDEFQLEDNLLVKPKLLDTPDSSDNEGSQFSASQDGGSDDNFEANLPSTPSKRRLLPKESVPMTPTKRRLLDTSQVGGLLASPAKAQVTPRSKARLMGIKARTLPHPSLPARPPQLSLMSQDQVKTLTPYQRAKRLLHVGATPDHLPCREDQYEEIMACVEDAVEEGIGGCVYVSGVPGTGKTATVREVIRALTLRAEQNQMNPFSFVEINGIKMADASQAYTLLWSAISGGQRRAPKTALAHLSSHFARVGATFSGAAGGRGRTNGGAGVGAGPGRAATVVLMDELDQLVTARQDVMYNMFNWPNTRGSRLVVIAVANTMDLPERTLNAKVASRLGMTRITFMPYTDRQLVEIVKSRLGIASTVDGDNAPPADAVTQGCENIMSMDAITYVSKRVSNVSGDARRMLDVCRRAIELVESRSSMSAAPAKPVSILDMRSVLDSMVKSGKVSHILSLPLHAKILLLSLLSCLRRSGLAEANLSDVQAHHCAVSRMYAIKPPLTEGFTQGVSEWDSVSLNAPLSALCSLGLIICVGQGAGTGRAAGFARLMLACQEDEVRLAFEHDPDERLRKML